jgi:hypothetical protein
MQIQFPKRVQLGFRPWYGLTLRQLGYLVIAGVLAGGVVLFGPVEGNELLWRVLIGLGIISIGVALAFFRKDGLTAERWVATQIKFLLRPHKRVWTRRDGGAAPDQVAEILLDQAPQSADQPVHSHENDDEDFLRGRLLQPSRPTTATSAAVIVLIDMAMLLSLFTLGVYLSRGGLEEIQGWFMAQWGK